jgi:hypothetical protein
MRKTVYAAALMALAFAAEANASQVVTPWYYGRWSCLIDGRPSTMLWRTENDSRQTCRGGVCSQTSGVKIAGYFKERTGPWVKLQRVRASDVGLAMLYNNTDPWVLNRNGAGAARGHTTWQGSRYPLVCNKA